MSGLAIWFVVGLTCLASIASAQTKPLISPEVHADRTVTFRFKDPNAKKVDLELEGKGAIPMVQDKDGVWSVTTAVLDPEIYGYTFSADGETRLDPLNPETKPNLVWPNNLVLVPGRPPRPWEVQDLPHGEIHHHFYHSAAAGDDRDYFVYTPPGYQPTARTRYPVLYLLHGNSDMASAWSQIGKANFIMDSLIATGQAKPMIVVMPLGYGVTDFANPQIPRSRDRAQRNYDLFIKALLFEVIPAVEHEYRVSTNRKKTAIAGLSMGGAESLITGLNNLDRFAYVGSFSAGLRDDPASHFPGLTGATANRKLRLLWIACGQQDGLIEFNRKLVAWLRQQGVQLTAVETPGMHEWPVWRQNLIAFASQLFN